MKSIAPTVCGLVLGFLSARWIPGFSGQNPDPGSAPSLSLRSQPPAAGGVPKKSTRTLRLDGDWRAEATAWAREDPAGLRDWLVRRGEPPDQQLLSLLFTEWAARDADAAFEAAFNLPGDFRQEKWFFPEMLNRLLEKPSNLGAVLKWAPQVEAQIDAWPHPGQDWLQDVPSKAMAAQLAEAVRGRKSGGGYTSTLTQILAKNWAAHDPAAALAWARSLPPGSRAPAAAGALSAWSEKDPQAVLDYLAGGASSAERWNAYAPLAKLAGKDPRAAMDWFEKNRGIPDPNCIPQIYHEWCRSDQTEARDYAMGIGDPVLRRDCLEAWAEAAHPKGLWAALNDAQDAGDRRVFLKAMARTLPETDPAGAEGAATFRQMITDGKLPEATPEIAVAAAERLVSSSPQEALDWAASLPGPLQSASVKETIRQWAGKDRVAAAQAVEKLPEGPVKDAAAAALPR